MKRVLLYSSGIIAEEKPSGGELRFLELAKYMAGREDTDLCCADDNDTLRPLELQANIQMKRSDGAPAFLPGEARILITNRDSLKRIAKGRYHAVIAFDVPPSIGLVLSGVKNIVLMIRKDLIGYENVKNSGTSWKKKTRILYQWLCESVCLRNAKQVICQCVYDRDTILNRHPLLRRKLIPKFEIQINNVNPSWIVQRAQEAGAEKTGEEETQHSVFRVCFIGGFDDLRKGQELFLRAAEHLTKEIDDMEFLLIGGGKNLSNYQDRYESDRIRFLGRMDNPIKILKDCDLLAVPSLADSCPNTVMEALYTNVPVIGSRTGGIPEILEDDEALFSPDWESLVNRIIYYYRDRSAYLRLKEKQKKRREELSFDWAESITKLIFRE